MCGRYSLAIGLDDLDERFALKGSGLIQRPRFNIAPTQEVLTVVNDGSENQCQSMKWGLIPHWSKHPSIGNRMINARAETVMEKPSFRQAFQSRRCMVVADGFYEWRKHGRVKIPMRITLKTGELFGFAGLWELWDSPNGEQIYSCSIITTTPNATMESIHSRMPVILSKDAEDRWLDVGLSDTDELRDLMIPYPDNEIEAYEVSSLVNSPKNDMSDVLSRVDYSEPRLL